MSLRYSISQPRSRVRAVSRFAFAALALCLMSACGGGGGGSTPFVIGGSPFVDGPYIGGGGNGNGGNGSGGVVPPPAPTVQPVWNENAYQHGRVPYFGAYPSDLERYGDTLFTVDADEIDSSNARIVPVDMTASGLVPSALFLPTMIRDMDLVDALGQPASLASPIGFGFFVNDLAVASPTLGFALVNAGGSDTRPNLSNLIVFNPSTGAIVQVVNLAIPYSDSTTQLVDSNGAYVNSSTFMQSSAEGIAYVPGINGQDLLYVAMANATNTYPAIWNPGTLQCFRVTQGAPLPVSQFPEAGRSTRTLQTLHYNPVELSVIYPQSPPGNPPTPRLLVTVAGALGADANFNLIPATPAAVEAYDAVSGYREGWFAMGMAALAAKPPAIGQDGAGNYVGFFPSQITGEIYLLNLKGLYSPVIAPNQLAILRGVGNGIPIVQPSGASVPGRNISGVALSGDGRTLIATTFGDLFASPTPKGGTLYALSLPHNVVTGSGFGTQFVPEANEFAAANGRNLSSPLIYATGPMQDEVFAVVSGALDANFLGLSPASIGSLNTHDAVK